MRGLIQHAAVVARAAVVVLASGALMVLATALASPAMAATTVPVSMTFNEPVAPAAHSGCPILANGFCGRGQVIPFGQATETIQFGAACGGNCDLRTINLAGGSIFIHEVSSNGTCPGTCQPNPALPGSSTLTDEIVGGTGKFTNATGNLSGSVTATGAIIRPTGVSVVKLSGTITLAN